MPVIPQFTPSQAPGQDANMALAGANATQSWMDRAAQRQQMGANTQLTQAQTAQMQAALPAIQAKAAADQITAQNTITQAQIVQGARARAANDSTQAMQEYLDVPNVAQNEDGTTDFDSQHQAYVALAAKYSTLGILPEYKPFWGQLQGSIDDSFKMAMNNNLGQIALQRAKAVQDAMTQRTMFTNTTRQSIASGAQQAQENAATTRAGGVVESAQTRAGAQEADAQVQSYERAAENAERMAANATDPAQKQQFLSTANQYRQRMDGIFSSGAQDGAPAAPPTAPAGGAAPGSPLPGQKTVNVGGVQVPVFVSKSTGKRYYQYNGKTYPLQAGGDSLPDISFTPPAAPAAPDDQAQ